MMPYIIFFLLLFLGILAALFGYQHINEDEYDWDDNCKNECTYSEDQCLCENKE